MTGPDPTGSCPKCGATTLQAVPLKQSSVAKELVKEYFLATTQGSAASSEPVLQHVCARCGCRWIPRTRQERQLRALSGQLGQEAMQAAQAETAAGGAKGRQNPVARTRRTTWVLVAVLAFVLFLVLVT